MHKSQTTDFKYKRPCLAELETGKSLQSVSIIILNWNQKKLLNDCLKSVLNTDYPEVEIIVSDNGSTDGSVELVKEKFPNVVLIENNANLGFCTGNNVAIKQAKGDIIVLLNNDTWVDKDWVKELVKASNDSNVGIIGCKLLFAGTSIIQSLGYHSNLLGHHENINLLRVDNQKEVEHVADVDYVSGAALAIKRSVINEIGLFDPMFYAYFEDVDLCYRAKEAGYRVIVAPKAVVHHFGSVSWTDYSFKRVFLTEKNRFLFLFKHYRGLSLLKALTLHDFKNTFQMMREKAKFGGLTVDVLNQAKGQENRSKSNYRKLISAAADWACAKFLAYLILIQLFTTVRRNRR